MYTISNSDFKKAWLSTLLREGSTLSRTVLVQIVYCGGDFKFKEISGTFFLLKKYSISLVNTSYIQLNP